jgi:hypothetical protein
MDVRRVLLGVCVVALLYGAYRGASCLLRSDESALRAQVDALAAGFKDGNASAVLELLTKDFVATYRTERVARAELVDYLNFVFFRQQERIELRGGIDGVVIDGDTASVVWEGVAVRRSARGAGAGTEMHRGLGNLEFRKVGGVWLLASAEAVPGEER